MLVLEEEDQGTKQTGDKKYDIKLIDLTCDQGHKLYLYNNGFKRVMNEETG